MAIKIADWHARCIYDRRSETNDGHPGTGMVFPQDLTFVG